MPARALASQPDAATVPIPDKRTRIPPRIRQAAELLLSGECKTQKAAAERAGVSPDWLCRQLATDRIQVFVARETRRNLSRGGLRASARIVELLDGQSEHVALDASKYVLALDGIKPAADAQVSVNIDIKAGYIIDLSEPQMRTIDGHVNRDASGSRDGSTG